MIFWLSVIIAFIISFSIIGIILFSKNTNTKNNNMPCSYTRDSCVAKYHNLIMRLISNEDIDIILKEADELYGIIENDTDLRGYSIRERRQLEDFLEKRIKKIDVPPQGSYLKKRTKYLNEYESMTLALMKGEGNKNTFRNKSYFLWQEIKDDYALRGATIDSRELLKSLL